MPHRIVLASVILSSAILAGAALPALAAAVTDPKAAIGLTPDQLQWQKGAANDQTWPIGARDKEGQCLEIIRWKPGNFSRPHYHCRARHAVVLEGTWWVATSNVYDPANLTVPYPKGSVVTNLPGGVHYDGAKPETSDAVVAIFMQCPLDGIPAEKK